MGTAWPRSDSKPMAERNVGSVPSLVGGDGDDVNVGRLMQEQIHDGLANQGVQAWAVRLTEHNDGDLVLVGKPRDRSCDVRRRQFDHLGFKGFCELDVLLH